MAEYHLHGQIIKRSEGRSAVNAAAYRAGEALYDKRLDQTFDYTRKREVEESIILGPVHAPAWMFDREMLWNTVETVERHKAAQLAREFDIALPIELVGKDPAAAKAAFQSWVQDMFVAEGLMADINFHNMRSKNPHAHVMTTMRRVHPQAKQFSEGSRYAFESTKARDQNDWGYMDFWRETWADYANAAMAERGIDARIDHRTLIEQGIVDREPGIHIGPTVKAMNDRDIETDRWTKNAIIWFENSYDWFEENDRYVAFLDAEEAEERRLQEEEASRKEAEGKELEAAFTVVARADDLADLAGRLAAALPRKRSEKVLARVGARLDHAVGRHISAGTAALDRSADLLGRAKGKIEVDLSTAHRAIARVDARFGAAAESVQKLAIAQALRLAGSSARLDAAARDVLGDHAVRFFDIADRFEAQACIVLARAAQSQEASAAKDGTAGRQGDLASHRARPAGAPASENVVNRPQQLTKREDDRSALGPPATRSERQAAEKPGDVERATRVLTVKLEAALKITKAIGSAILADTRAVTTSLAAVLWRGARDSAEAILLFTEQVGAAATRFVTKADDEDRPSSSVEEKVTNSNIARAPSIEPRRRAQDDLFLVRLHDWKPVPFKRKDDRWVLDTSQFDMWMKARADEYAVDPLVDAMVLEAVAARTQELMTLFGSSDLRLLERRGDQVSILRARIAEVSSALAAHAQELIDNDPLLRSYGCAALERWSAPDADTLASPTENNQGSPQRAAKAATTEPSLAGPASSADEEYEQFRQQAAHAAAKKSGRDEG